MLLLLDWLLEDEALLDLPEFEEELPDLGLELELELEDLEFDPEPEWLPEFDGLELEPEDLPELLSERLSVCLSLRFSA